MNIRRMLIAWVNCLAELVIEWQARLQMRNTIVITRDNDCLVLRRTASCTADALVKLTAGEMISYKTAEALRNHHITFELAREQVVARRLMLPTQAREFLSGIVSNQIDRLSPWPQAEVVFAIDARPHEIVPGILDVLILIALRAQIETACEELKAIGLSPDRIVANLEEERKSPLLTLWNKPSGTSQRMAYSLSKTIGVGLGALVLLSAGTSLWAICSASTALSDRDQVAEHAANFKKPTEASDKQKDLVTLSPVQRAWVYKEHSAMMVIMLDALTRALPDSAYLTELHVENSTLRLFGLTSDAPSLITPLEQSGYFSDAHFFAPTTKGPGSSLYKFFVESRLRDRLSLAGDRQK